MWLIKNGKEPLELMDMYHGSHKVLSLIPNQILFLFVVRFLVLHLSQHDPAILSKVVPFLN